MVGVFFDSPLTDQISQELSRRHSEGTFLWIELHFVPMKELESLFKMTDVVPRRRLLTSMSSTYIAIVVGISGAKMRLTNL